VPQLPRASQLAYANLTGAATDCLIPSLLADILVNVNRMAPAWLYRRAYLDLMRAVTEACRAA
jgi:hypothetical protein